MTIQEAIKEAHDCAVAHKLYDPPPSVPALLALINTELSEVIKADRKERYFRNLKWSGKSPLITDFLLWPDFYQAYACFVKNTLESGLADACIRIFDLAGRLGFELEISPIQIVETDIPGNIMEAMSQIGFAYAETRTTNPSISVNLDAALGIIFAIAKKLDFDLWQHIEAAMRYNWLREVKHGKKY